MHPAADSADALMRQGNFLLREGRAEAAVAAYEAALALRPDHAATHYNLGNAWLARDDAATAERCYARALALDPAHAGAHNNRGNALRRLGRLSEAAGSYRSALALRPELHGSRDNLASALLGLHQPDAAEAELRAVLAAAPDYAPACNNLGGALLMLDRAEEAREWFGRALVLDPGLAQARFGAAHAWLGLGRFAEGFAAYEARWLDPRFREDARLSPAPRLRPGMAVAGRTVLLRHEQGFGDTVQFARYAPMLRARGARVVLEVQAPLVRLLRPIADKVVAAGGPLPPHDLFSPLLSLPWVFGTTRATIPAAIPYLRATRPAWEARRPGLNLALCLRGSPGHPEDALRSIPAPLATPLLAIPGVAWHVVQKDAHADDAALAGPPVTWHGRTLTDFAETADLLAAMDAVVAVDTALAHLAGALGRRTWVLLQYAADWRWLRGREDSTWYSTARLLRQESDRAWPPVLARLLAHVAEAAATRRPDRLAADGVAGSIPS